MVSINHFSLWVSLSSLFFSLFSFLFRSFNEGKIVESSVVVHGGDDDVSLSPEDETKGGGVIESLEKERNEFSFSFKFQTYEEFSKSNKENICCEKLDWSGGSSSLGNRYEILPEKSTSHFVEEAEIPSYTVEVLNSCLNHGVLGNESEVSGKVLEHEIVSQEITECSTVDGTEEVSGKFFKFEAVEEEKPFTKFEDEEEEITERFRNEKEESSPKIQSEEEEEEEEDNDFLKETDFAGSDSDADVDIGGRFLSDTDFDLDFKTGGYEPDDEINVEESEKSAEGNGKGEEDSEELNGLETEWEHQELIEQLKMELKKVRATGLATIFEESESPKIMGELKPWKIDEKFQHGDLMEELHKFYRSYRERMRKLDILNYQKMYAMGVLQSKDPLNSFSSNDKSSSSSSIISAFTHNLRLYRRNKCQVDPMKDFIREVHCDLEMVYVGQLCLSWEFIQWQYEKALDLWESEPHGLHHYNEVAGEFQQFQVLLQRFLENEPFEGPRVENYVKHRCVARNLLQVPVIREDKRRDRRKGRRGKLEDGYEAITSDMLVEMLQESIRVIWQFIRADKDCHHSTNGSLKRPKKLQVELQEPADEQLLTHIQIDLQKKEKRLKEIVRSGHCILKKLKKNEENEETEGALCFFCEVDMKLVGRVLRMSRLTTDQLIWCSNKLSRISFSNRKIHVEPSFFLFPC
ncbi:uncharacterized protein LOC101211770 isoform X1 [Cucumis sativus]|uniref:Ribosomal protein L34Ae n=2 Tax=Cucumis sativus TaxID=3659 RepID=A0A0A0LHR8_CUCSA|nr:uncharacterized protein LOC101211770 isoform X1 [Cucumis sativus]KGN59576.1 hypothetical protein Csa_001432 [Cucumis sativus]